MNPFSHLVAAVTAEKPEAAKPSASSVKVAGLNTTDTLVHLLDVNGPMSTNELGAAVKLQTRLVWGLLKARLGRGQLTFEGGLWAINRDWLPPAVTSAIALLRDLGWTVEPPHSH